MVARGDLGKIRVVVAEFAYGHHADAEGVKQPRLAQHEDRIDQVLHEVGRGDAEQRHQHGANDCFQHHAAMHLK